MAFLSTRSRRVPGGAGGGQGYAHAQLARYFEAFYGYPLELVAAIQACIAGTAGEVLDHLRRYWEAGARTFVVRLASLGDTEGQMEAVATRVLPELGSWHRA